MEISFDLFSVVCFAAFLALIFLLIHLYSTIVLEQEKIRRKLKVQGIKGPPASFLYGNLPEMEKLQNSKAALTNHADFVAHDYTSTLFPYFEQWRKDYGSVYTYSTGMRQHLYVNQPDLVKEMNQSITLDLGKPPYLTKKLAPMLGNGILRSNGPNWAQQRKIVAPEFYMDKVKGMVGLMVKSTQPLLQKWEECIEAQGGVVAEVRVDEDLRGVSADVISRACFGSSYVEGKQIFSKLRDLQKAISMQSLPFSAASFGLFPTKKQSQIDNLEREIELLIWDAVKRKQEYLESGSSSQKDLLQLILERAMNDETLSKDSSKRYVIDNCKTVYFAGHESTAVAASWCLMLLALHPEWQHRMRTELAQVCKNHVPSANSLLQLNKLTMVIQEALRLYPPGAFVSREALEETRIGGLIVPKGVCLWTLIPTLHRDPDMWGLDANEFKPERFSEGVNKACKYPQAYIPFGVGPRICLGKNFAVVQLKVILSMIISKFHFSLSPNYHHSPVYRMIVEPGHGVQILVRKI